MTSLCAPSDRELGSYNDISTNTESFFQYPGRLIVGRVLRDSISMLSGSKSLTPGMIYSKSSRISNDLNTSSFSAGSYSTRIIPPSRKTERTFAQRPRGIVCEQLAAI